MQRLVKALQRALAREAVLPSVGSAVGAAAIGSLARLALACGDVAAVAPRQGFSKWMIDCTGWQSIQTDVDSPV